MTMESENISNHTTKKKNKNKLCEECNVKQAICGFRSDMIIKWCTNCSKTKHPGSENLKQKRCEDCDKPSSTNWGLDKDKLFRWCKNCAQNHNDAINLRKKKFCQDCKDLVPTYGLEKGKPQWCKECSKKYPGAFDVKHPMCEICNETRPCYGYVNQGKLRWCYICSQTITDQDPVVNLTLVKCEDCKEVTAIFGLEQNRVRWCSKCSMKHPGSFDVKSKFCEDCHALHPSYGNKDEKTRRWCSRCSKNHKNAVNNSSKFCVNCELVLACFGFEGQRPKWCYNCSQDYENTVNLVTKRCANQDCVMKSTVAYDKIFCSQCDPKGLTNFRRKEKRVFEVLTNAFPDIIHIWNKMIGGDKECEGRRKKPDILIERNTFGLIIEVDEDQHKSPSYGGELCEIRRMSDLMNAYGLPLVFIRYNPNSWQINGTYQLISQVKREKELINTVHKYLQMETTNSHVLYMYYDDHGVGYTQDFQTLVEHSIAMTQNM